MNEQQIREIVRSEMERNYVSGSPMTPSHNHDGVNGLKIPSANVIFPTRFNGTIDMNQSTTYTIPFKQLNVTGNPSSVTFYGGALNTVTNMHAMVVGNAQIGGTSYQFQPGTPTSVTLNNIGTPIIQGSASMVVKFSSPNASYINNSQGHIVYVDSGGTAPILALATVTGFDKSTITVDVQLAANWRISGLWIIT